MPLIPLWTVGNSLDALRVNSGRGNKLRFPAVLEETIPDSHIAACPVVHQHMASQTDLTEQTAAPQPSLTDVMAAITACQTMLTSCQATLSSKIEAAQQDVGLHRVGG